MREIRVTRRELDPRAPDKRSRKLRRELLRGVEGIAQIRFTAADVVRHPLVARIVEAYDRRSETDPAH